MRRFHYDEMMWHVKRLHDQIKEESEVQKKAVRRQQQQASAARARAKFRAR